MPHYSIRSPRAVLAEIKALWHLAWPIMVAQIAQTGHAFVDAVMAGHVSADDLAAVSVGGSIWVTLMVTLMGLTLSVSPMVSQYFGAKQHEAIAPITRQGLWQALFLAGIAYLVAQLALPIFGFLGLSPTVQHKAEQFLQAIALGLPAFALYRVLYSYSASVNQTKPIMIIALLGLAINIPINYVLIYGKLGFPALGGVGCGYATAISLWLSLAAMIAWLHWAPAYQNFRLFTQWAWPDLRQQRQLLRLGFPIGLMFFVEVSAFAIVALLIGRLGAVEVSAHQITLNFSSLTFMIPSSLGTALTVRVGHSIGASNWREARFVSWVGVIFSLMVAACSAALILVFAKDVAAIYTTDTAVISLAAYLLSFAALFQLSDATQVCTSGALRGYKVTRKPMLIHMTAFWVIGLPLGYILGLAPAWTPWHPAEAWGAAGFWLGLVVSLTLSAVFLSLLLWRVSHKQHGHAFTTSPATKADENTA